MKNKLNLFLITSIVFFTGYGCTQNTKEQNQNKAAVKQTAANKANDTNAIMQSETASTQTLKTESIMFAKLSVFYYFKFTGERSSAY